MSITTMDLKSLKQINLLLLLFLHIIFIRILMWLSTLPILITYKIPSFNLLVLQGILTVRTRTMYTVGVTYTDIVS